MLIGSMRYRKNSANYLWPALLGVTAVGALVYVATRKRSTSGALLPDTIAPIGPCQGTYARHDFERDADGRSIPLIAAAWPAGVSYAEIKKRHPLAFLSEDGTSIVAFGFWLYPKVTPTDVARSNAIDDAIDNIAHRFCTDCTSGAWTDVKVQGVQVIETDDRNLVGRGMTTLDGQEAVGNFLVMIRIPADGYRCVS